MLDKIVMVICGQTSMRCVGCLHAEPHRKSRECGSMSCTASDHISGDRTGKCELVHKEPATLPEDMKVLDSL